MSDLVFAVGLPLTGNERLAEFLKAQGYNPRIGGSWAWPAAVDYLSRGEKRILVDCLRDGYDSWVGWPFACYMALWERYQDAKFILTICGSPEEWKNKWIEWRKSLSEGTDPQAVLQRPLIDATIASVFGDKNPSIGHAENVYERHHANVEKFLHDKGANFIVVNLASRRADRALARLVPKKGVASE